MKILEQLRKHCVVFLAGIIFAVLCFVGLNVAMVPVSKSEYCGSKCHEMNTAYRSWELSVHGANKSGIRTECIDCHLPKKDKYFTHITAKAYAGIKDVYKHHFGGEYDTENTRAKVLEQISSQRCLNCHDSLLSKPSNTSARIAHIATLNEPDSAEHRCIKCHENTGHERNKKLFSL
jgi:cytochrome c nitrite reductase small subunit